MKTYPSTGQLASRYYSLFEMPQGAFTMQQFGDEIKVGVKIDGVAFFKTYKVQKSDDLKTIEKNLKKMVSEIQSLALVEA